VTKKRQVWPLRKVLSEFYDDIFNLIPCWLASPEAVSSIFPLGTIFDLVIFDEASQCFAEKSIPALERGRQVVISGDSQQLSPNDLYQARWEDQDEGLIETEKDSLLDLAVQYLPQVMLKGHYRSKYLELIDFSNRHFYKNKLQLLPHANDLDTHIPPIEYVYLEDGIWEKNANIIEAKEVIKIINKLLIDGHKSIGVITFNYKQQSLIEDLLNDFAKENKLTLPKELFIKNIENVQGDEREHIIFSLGYAKTRTGRLKMNFGSLNQEHGEKRLNVAITRAKSRITIIASILPHELNTEEAKHQGPNLLKEYLTYSLNISNGNFRYEQDTTSQIQNVLLKSIIQRKLKKELGMSEIPFADLRIHTKRHDLILTDDSSYYNAISAKEAHITTPNLLESRAWETKRIYSRNYWMNREKFYLDLKK
jgi:superfamily I DNA and/or RNA helicase